ncbi:MAG TPA: HD domain-containing phosphohydrolase [Novimethylophilus sp.]|uniref:HD-GYP domain-containing protein n=1 Tax=Novimethylophilus sp. TaxID=2137426 RepID=UPI002F3F6AEA
MPFSIYDEKGVLLLRKGIAITLPSQIDRLLARNAAWEPDEYEYTGPEPRLVTQPTQPQSQPVFDQMGGLMLNLKHIFTTVIKNPEQIDLPARIKKLAATIQALCDEDLDGALAAPHLDYFNPYIVVHQVMGAVLAEIIASHKGVAAEERLLFICAALTRDIGQLTLQSEIDKCDGPLPDALKAAMHQHPLQGRDMLARAGIIEAAWLDAVAQHHERLDGSGYPARLQDASISLGARILAIADSYSAMTKPRPYRNKALNAQNALRDMYLEKDVHMDGELTQGLIKEIGMLPPGSIVRLKCGEIAAIRNRTMKADEAVVFSVYNQKGMPLSAPVRRETNIPGYEITGIVPFAECRSATVTIKRLWLNEFKL